MTSLKMRALIGAVGLGLLTQAWCSMSGISSGQIAPNFIGRTLVLDRHNVVQANFSGYTPDNIRHLRAMLPASAQH